MVRKALKNIPQPDEEKLRALYSAPQQKPEPAPVEQSKQDYEFTSRQTPEYTSKQGYESPRNQVDLSTSTQVHTPQNPQAYKTTSPHVYNQHPESPIPIQQPPAPSPDYRPMYPAPDAREIPAQHVLPGPIQARHPQPSQQPDLFRRQTYHLRPDQIEQIRVEAFHSRRKISEVIRDIIDAYYQRERKF